MSGWEGIALITEAQSHAHFAARGLAGEQPDDPACSHCQHPTDPDDLADLDGQQVCGVCATALVGSDVSGPEHGRDL